MNQLSKITIVLLTSALFISCSESKTSSTLYTISFDELSGYVDNPSIKSDNSARSGNKCVQLSKDLIYGPTFSKKIKDIRPSMISKLTVSGWVKSNSKNGSMQLVCSIDSADKTIFWNCIDSKTLSGNHNEWQQMSITFDLSKVNNANNKLNIYPRHTGEGNSFLDDLEFSFE